MATTRQKKAVRNIGKYRTEAQALENADYSPSYAKSGLIKRTKGWQELMDKYLPDKDLARAHKEGLEANKRSTSLTEPDQIDPDYPTRHKYLDTAYKLKGKYAPEKFEGVVKGFLTKEQTDELFHRRTKKTDTSR